MMPVSQRANHRAHCARTNSSPHLSSPARKVSRHHLPHRSLKVSHPSLCLPDVIRPDCVSVSHQQDEEGKGPACNARVPSCFPPCLLSAIKSMANQSGLVSFQLPCFSDVPHPKSRRAAKEATAQWQTWQSKQMLRRDRTAAAGPFGCAVAVLVG